jgi:hypothetical protein
LLREAKGRKIPEALEPIAHRFVHTAAGAEALQLMALDHFDRGHLRAAVLLAGVPVPPAGLKA